MGTAGVSSALETVQRAVSEFWQAVVREVQATDQFFCARTGDLMERVERMRQQGINASLSAALNIGVEAEQVLVCLQIAQVAIGKIVKKYRKALAELDAAPAASAPSRQLESGASGGDAEGGSSNSATTTTSASSATERVRDRGNMETVSASAVRQVVETATAKVLAPVVSRRGEARRNDLDYAGRLLRRYISSQAFVCDVRRLNFLVDFRQRKDCALLALYKMRRQVPPSSGGASPLSASPTTVAAVTAGHAPKSRSLLRFILGGGRHGHADPSAPKTAAAAGGDRHPRTFNDECQQLAVNLNRHMGRTGDQPLSASPYSIATKFYLTKEIGMNAKATEEALAVAVAAIPSHFTCPICLDMLYETRELPCRHRLCALCLEEATYGAGQHGGSAFLCPLCRLQDASRRACCADGVPTTGTPSDVDTQEERRADAEPAEQPAVSGRRADSIDALLRVAFASHWRRRQRKEQELRLRLERRKRYDAQAAARLTSSMKALSLPEETRPSTTSTGPRPTAGTRARSPPQIWKAVSVSGADALFGYDEMGDFTYDRPQSAPDDVTSEARPKRTPKSACSII
eukprot:ctg_3073.g649